MTDQDAVAGEQLCPERLRQAENEPPGERPPEAAETADAQAGEAGKVKREELVCAAKRDIEAETRRSLESIRKEVADLTVIATEKVTRKTLDSDDHKRLVEEALAEVDFTSLAGEGTGSGAPV